MVMTVCLSAGALPAVAATTLHVPFRVDGDGRMVVDALLSGEAISAMVDTGLSVNLMLQPAAASRAGVRPLPFLKSGRSSGIDGMGDRGRLALAKIVTLGGTPGDWDMPAVIQHTPILKHDAMLGMGFLDGYDVSIDFKMRRISLSKPAHGAASGRGFSNCAPGKPSYSTSGRCGVDAVYVDTGARRTLVNSVMAAQLGLPASGGEPTTITGASGRTFPARRYTGEVTIGGVTVSAVDVADFPGRGGCKRTCAEAILGMDALGRLSRLTITRQRILLEP
jgi:predicted aspartyl protease